MPKRLRCHKCRCCHHLYEPDPRSRYHQTYCSKPDCQKASKTASQRKWRRSDKGRDYFRGPANAHRVQVWRKAHPGYARKRAKPSRALQDGLSPQTLVPPADTPTLNPQSSTDPRALQETMSVQSLLLTGFIAHYFGPLQEDFAPTIQRLVRLGQQVSGPVPGVMYAGLQASALQGTIAASPAAVQLDRPSPGP